jgi:hypothetical protein
MQQFASKPEHQNLSLALSAMQKQNGMVPFLSGQIAAGAVVIDTWAEDVTDVSNDAAAAACLGIVPYETQGNMREQADPQEVCLALSNVYSMQPACLKAYAFEICDMYRTASCWHTEKRFAWRLCSKPSGLLRPAVKTHGEHRKSRWAGMTLLAYPTDGESGRSSMILNVNIPTDRAVHLQPVRLHHDLARQSPRLSQWVNLRPLWQC